MKITSNNKPRFIIYGYELPDNVKPDFDYLGDDLDSSAFIKYRGVYYDLCEFMRTDSVPGWDGIISESFFSGILIKIIDADSVVVGSYYF